MSDFNDSGESGGSVDGAGDTAGDDISNDGELTDVGADGGDGGHTGWLDDGSDADGSDPGPTSDHGGVDWLDSLPDGVALFEGDYEAAAGLAERMATKGLAPSAFHEALSWYNDALDADQEFVQGRDADDRTAATATLRTDWGHSYDTRLGAIKEVISTAPFAEEILNARLSDGSALFNNPDVLKWLDGIVGASNRSAAASSNGVGSPTDERAEIENFMRTNNTAYIKDQKMQARYRQLIEGELAGEPAGKTSSDPNAAELAKIFRLMGNPNSAYWRGPKSAQMQARYRQLLGG